jgi:phosphoribosyl-AMP cyclohydrolase
MTQPWPFSPAALIESPRYVCFTKQNFRYLDMEKVDFAKGNGLVPVIVQDYRSREVLMMAYMNEEAWAKTRKTGKAHYYSRSRRRLWLKGEESGHYQEVKDILIDCDNDTLLLRVKQTGGGACHLGYGSCFFRKKTDKSWKPTAKRIFDPGQVYKNRSKGKVAQ